MIETILIAIFAAKIKKYNIKPFFKTWTTYPFLILTALYVVLEFCMFNKIYSPVKYTNIFKILYFISMFIIVIKHNLYISSFIGSIFILIGSLLNNIAIRVNSGKMPVFITLSKFTGYVSPTMADKIDNIHTLGTSNTKYKFLTDIFDTGYCIMSIGDILIRVFVFIVIYNAIKTLNHKINIYDKK